jgi:NADH:ubiquinone oxidoreductase subunit B-like Fe-S oxidoreductase
VIASHGDHTREGLALLRKSNLICVCGRLAHQNAVVTFFDLVDSPCWVVRGDRNIAAIEYGGPAVKRVGSKRYVVASTVEDIQISFCSQPLGEIARNSLKIETTTALTNTLRSKSCTRSVARAGIVGSSKERDIVLDLVGCQAGCVLETTERADTREDGIRLTVVNRSSERQRSIKHT